MKFLEKIRRYIRISGVAPIGRRYFIMDAFDGATTILGIVIGAYIAEVTNEFWVMWSGLGATLAIVLLGFAGSYMTEEAERANLRLEACEDLYQAKRTAIMQMSDEDEKHRLLSVVNA